MSVFKINIIAFTALKSLGPITLSYSTNLSPIERSDHVKFITHVFYKLHISKLPFTFAVIYLEMISEKADSSSYEALFL